MFDLAPLQEGVDEETTPAAKLEYVGLRVVEAVEAKVKVYRSRFVNGIFNPRSDKTQPFPNPAKGVGRFDFKEVFFGFQGLQLGRFIQIMTVMSTRRTPTTPTLKDQLQIKVKGGSCESPTDLMGPYKKWTEPAAGPEFALLSGAAATY